MDKLDNTFEKFLTTQSVHVEPLDFLVNLAFASLLSYLLGRLYIRYGLSLSNRTILSRTFVLTTMATMLIITIVKSSLALSLGLVGALSIVRFRAAIKEPEELAYLFMSVAIGLGFGADQRTITTLGFVLIATVVWLKSLSTQRDQSQDMQLLVSSHNPKKVDLRSVVDVLNRFCSSISLRRFDDTSELLEASFAVRLAGYAELESATAELHKLGDDVTVTFVDSTRIGGLN